MPALNINRCRKQLGRFADAEAGLDTLLAECQEQNAVDFEGMVLIQQADLEMIRGRLFRAASLFHQALYLGSSLPYRFHTNHFPSGIFFPACDFRCLPGSYL